MMEPMITVENAARLLGKHITTLHRWRRKGSGPRFLRIGSRILYRQSAIESFLNSCEIDPAAAAIQSNRNRRARLTAGKALGRH